MKKLTTLMALTVFLGMSGHALAHGEKPRHGGMVQSANDLSFELVNKAGVGTIYISDHGTPVNTAGASGKLTVLNGAQKSEVALEPGGDGTMVTTEPVKLEKTSKAIARISLADKKAATVRFAAPR